MWFIGKAKLKRMIKENAERFAQEENELLAAVSAEIKRINELEALKPNEDLTEKTVSAMWEEYWEHYDSLDRTLRKRVAYLLARRGWSGGHSGFHSSGFQSTLPFPIKMCGWFYYYDSSHHFKDGGVMFRIDPECFGRWDAQLFYFDDDNWPCYTIIDEAKMLELIRSFSSGISDVHIEHLTCTDQFGETKERPCVVFRLDTSAVKKSIPGADPTTNEPLGDFVFCLPRAGEFWCTLGHIHDGELITLHHDNFCMK